MSLANISIVGNLVKPPEQMHFSNGRNKTTLVVAVNNHGRPNRGGDSADFYRVETWGKLAELAGTYLSKGNQVAVSGRLVFDRWVDRDGKARVTPLVEASQVSFPSKLKVVEGEKGAVQELTNGELTNGELTNGKKVGSPITGTLVTEDDDPFIDSPSLQEAV
jgi:single-strand DNA-binding protein